jgi:two-component system, NarL family, nitrate/nitrite response regulator NarL
MMKLLICDDHRLLLDALRIALTQEGYTVVATALDPREAVAAAREHQPDVCLLDVNFPHANALSAIGGIHEVSADTKVVILSASSDRELVANAIAQGAQGFVGKEQSVGAIVEALKMAHSGHLAVDPLLLQEILRPHVAEDRSNVVRLDLGSADRRRSHKRVLTGASNWRRFHPALVERSKKNNVAEHRSRT